MTDEHAPRITIFTPTYNRAYILTRLYESLVAQTCRDFEWIVADDCSTDDTEALLKRWTAEGNIDMRYFRMGRETHRPGRRRPRNRRNQRHTHTP